MRDGIGELHLADHIVKGFGCFGLKEPLSTDGLLGCSCGQLEDNAENSVQDGDPAYR